MSRSGADAPGGGPRLGDRGERGGPGRPRIGRGRTGAPAPVPGGAGMPGRRLGAAAGGRWWAAVQRDDATSVVDDGRRRGRRPGRGRLLPGRADRRVRLAAATAGGRPRRGRRRSPAGTSPPPSGTWRTSPAARPGCYARPRTPTPTTRSPTVCATGTTAWRPNAAPWTPRSPDSAPWPRPRRPNDARTCSAIYRPPPWTSPRYPSRCSGPSAKPSGSGSPTTTRPDGPTTTPRSKQAAWTTYPK